MSHTDIVVCYFEVQSFLNHPFSCRSFVLLLCIFAERDKLRLLSDAECSAGCKVSAVCFYFDNNNMLSLNVFLLLLLFAKDAQD